MVGGDFLSFSVPGNQMIRDFNAGISRLQKYFKQYNVHKEHTWPIFCMLKVYEGIDRITSIG